MHAPDTAAALGQDVPGTVVRPYGGPLDTRAPVGGIVAYHGTPHDFDRFSSAHIGSGEGLQAYGRGLYFAENEDVARGYQRALSTRDADYTKPEEIAAEVLDASRGDRPAAVKRARDMLINSAEYGGFTVPQREAITQAGKILSTEEPITSLTSGHLYQVRIARDPAHFLDWDKPAHQQSPYVTERLRQLGARDLVDNDPVTKTLEALGGDPKWKGQWDEDRTWKHMREQFPQASDEALQGIADRVQMTLSRGAPVRMNSDRPLGRMLAQAKMLGPEGSKKLQDAGIAGIKYLDEGSRGAGMGTQNYVAFNDHDIHVTHKNGVPLARSVALPDFLKGEARGAFMKELVAAGMSPVSFSKDLKIRADRLLTGGNALDHGRALADAAVDRAPAEVQDAILGRADAQRSGEASRDGSAPRNIAKGPGRLPDASQGLRRSSEAGGAPGEEISFGPADIKAYLDRKKAAAAPVGGAPQSLVGFLRAQGGIKEFGGEVKARDLHRTFPGLFNNRTGIPLDRAREAAAEAGYLGPDTAHAMANTDINDFLSALDNHPVYSIHDQDRIVARGARQSLRDLQGQYKQAAEDIENSFVEHGGHLPSLGKELLHDASTIMVHDRIPWDEALERARQNEIGTLLDDAHEEQSAARQTEYRNELTSAPVFRPEDIKAYLDAKKATRARAETFDEGVAGKVLQRAGRGGYEMPDAAVPAAIVPGGKPTDALAVRQYLAAGGTPEALADATAYSVRTKALRPDGTLDPNKVHTWLRQNSEAVAQMPPEVAAKFRNVADTQAAVDQMVARREAETAAFNKTAIARIAGLQHGEDVVKTIGGIFGQKDAVAQMRALADAAKADPAAKEGLRRALVERLLGRITSNVSNNASGISQIKGDTFLGFIRHNGAVLRQVFEQNELGAITAVGRDLDRAMRTHQTKGLISSPGTAQDLGAAKGSILGALTEELGPAGFAMLSHAAGAGPIMTGVSWLGSKTLGRMRAAGIASANDLVVKAMLDPTLAKKLLAKLPDAPDRGTAQALGEQFVRLSRSTAAGLYGSKPDQRARALL